MGQNTVPALPAPGPNQAYCEASALEAGFLVLPDHIFVSTARRGEEHLVPSLSFLLTNTSTRTRLLLDLGIKHETGFIPALNCPYQRNLFRPYVPIDVKESLAKGGLKSDEVTHICLSHVHWDHVGDPGLFPKAEFIVGKDARQLFQPGYPTDPQSGFPSDLLPPGRTNFVDPFDEAWKPIGPFPRALDFFGDGALYIIDSPGHLPGHLNVLARTSADGAWIYLAGDSAHDWRLLRGQGEIGDVHDEPFIGHICMHIDKEKAALHIRRIADLATLPKVRVILAHDNEWFAENKGGDAFWPGHIKTL